MTTKQKRSAETTASTRLRTLIPNRDFRAVVIIAQLVASCAWLDEYTMSLVAEVVRPRNAVLLRAVESEAISAVASLAQAEGMTLVRRICEGVEGRAGDTVGDFTAHTVGPWAVDIARCEAWLWRKDTARRACSRCLSDSDGNGLRRGPGGGCEGKTDEKLQHVWLSRGGIRRIG